MLKLAFAAAIIVLGASCTGLKKSQIHASENFAVATKGISRIPSDLYYRIYNLKSESQSLQLNTILATNNNTKESIQLITDDYREKAKFLEIAEQYSAAYLIVEQYSSLVLCLLDESYLRNFAKTKGAWEVSFNRLVKTHNAVSQSPIPASVGTFTSELIMQLGRMKIKDLQKKYLRQAIRTAREPFQNICDDFILLDSLKIKSELANLPAYLNNNYANFLENIRAHETGGNNPYYYYTNYTPIYTNWLAQVDELQVLTVNTLSAFRTLKSSFPVLDDYIHDPKAGDIPLQLEQLTIEYGKLAEMFNRFEYRRQKLNAASLLKQ